MSTKILNQTIEHFMANIKLKSRISETPVQSIHNTHYIRDVQKWRIMWKIAYGYISIKIYNYNARTYSTNSQILSHIRFLKTSRLFFFLITIHMFKENNNRVYWGKKRLTICAIYLKWMNTSIFNIVVWACCHF